MNRLGSLVRDLASEGLFPYPQPGDYSKSASALYQQLQNLMLQAEGTNPYGHKKCNSFDFMMKDIHRVMDYFGPSANVFQEKHKVHLKRQAEMIGIRYVQLPLPKVDPYSGSVLKSESGPELELGPHAESESESETESELHLAFP
jgi:hypothetical protein